MTVLSPNEKDERRKATARAKAKRLYHKWKHNPEWMRKWKERRKAWYARNAEKVKAKVNQYRSANKERLIAKAKAKYWQNPEAARRKNRTTYQRHKDSIRAAARSKYQQATAEQKAVWFERSKVCLIRNCANLEEPYIRRQLSKGTSLPGHVWPAQVVELKRATLKLKRQLKTL